jgi:Fe2+ transport system protein B
MLPSDPKKAAELGKAWGEVLADSIFGITDLFRDKKGMKEAANRKMEQQNQRQLIKNAKIKAENARKLQDEESRLLATLSAAEKEKYFKDKAALAKSNAEAQKQAEEAAEEREQLFIAAFMILIVLPAIIWLMLAGFAVMAKASGDYSTYNMLSKILPGF